MLVLGVGGTDKSVEHIFKKVYIWRAYPEGEALERGGIQNEKPLLKDFVMPGSTFWLHKSAGTL